MIRFGLIFNDGNDNIYLGLYEDGTITEFGEISDHDDFYTDLPLHKFGFVTIKIDEHQNLSIRDICDFEMAKSGENGPEITNVTDMLEDLDFPSDDTEVAFKLLLDDGLDIYKNTLN